MLSFEARCTAGREENIPCKGKDSCTTENGCEDQSSEYADMSVELTSLAVFKLKLSSPAKNTIYNAYR